MASVAEKIRPKSGFAQVLHIGLNAILPVLVFVLVRINFYQLALVLILLSKWRMLAVKPRYWLANIVSNGVDIIFGVSMLVLMINGDTYSWQLLWGAVYILWLIFIKPMSNILGVSVQAIIAQSFGLVALFIWLSGAPSYQLIIGVWAICYLAARHFFTAYEEVFSSMFAHAWGYFASALTWVLAHWLLFYGLIPQPAIILFVMSVGVGSLYYLEHFDKLNKMLKRQIILALIAVIVIILVFSDWSSKIV